MGEEKQEKTPAPAPAPAQAAPSDPQQPTAVPEAVDEKSVVPTASCDEKPDNSKALVVVEKPEEPTAEKSKEVKEEKEEKSGGSADRDAALLRIETEKRMSLVRAWEDNEKTKAENKATKKLSSISSWENTKKAALEAKLKTKEEELEKKKGECGEIMRNKMALIQKKAEEKKANVVAKRGEECVKAEESAAKYRVTGIAPPKKLLGCFSG